MTQLFAQTDANLELIEKRNKLIDEQEGLQVHHYRTDNTELTDDDKKHDALQSQIDAINAKIGTPI